MQAYIEKDVQLKTWLDSVVHVEPSVAPAPEPSRIVSNPSLVLAPGAAGSPIEFAKNAALYFVRDLPVAAGVKFQIVLFGSSHKSMNAASLDYDAQAEQHAVDWINANVRANLGGTEVGACFALSLQIMTLRQSSTLWTGSTQMSVPT
eukprot:205235-Pelagomonas_calceolata.AAC.5